MVGKKPCVVVASLFLRYKLKHDDSSTKSVKRSGYVRCTLRCRSVRCWQQERYTTVSCLGECSSPRDSVSRLSAGADRCHDCHIIVPSMYIATVMTAEDQNATSMLGPVDRRERKSNFISLTLLTSHTILTPAAWSICESPSDKRAPRTRGKGGRKKRNRQQQQQ